MIASKSLLNTLRRPMGLYFDGDKDSSGFLRIGHVVNKFSGREKHFFLRLKSSPGLVTVLDQAS